MELVCFGEKIPALKNSVSEAVTSVRPQRMV